MTTISKFTELEATLEQIEEVNKMLAFHRSRPEPNRTSIENYLELRADFMRQLAELLRAFKIEATFAVAA